MKIAIIGTGYVGLPTGIGMAELGHNVICIDVDQHKVNNLNAGKITLFEEGIEELFQKHLNKGLQFTTSMQKGVSDADVVMIAVGTPPHPVTGEADMCYIYAAAKELAQYITGYTVIANKSTVPVGTGNEVDKIIREINPNADFDVVSLPEFLREGFAMHDFFNPDRIVVGTESEKAKAVISEIYAPLKNVPLLFTNRSSSEVIKYASNAFLAMKIHYINEMADFCEKVGADIYEVAKGMGLDKRIGPKFLNPGPGYGGSCFPKDTTALAYMGRKYGAELSLIEATIAGNDTRKRKMAVKIKEAVAHIDTPKICIWGLAFKGGTDDVRESPAMQIIMYLLDFGLDIIVYDPQAMPNAKQILGKRVQYGDNAYSAATEADIIVVLTEWDCFKEIDLAEVAKLVRNRQLMDLRNIIDKDAVNKFESL